MSLYEVLVIVALAAAGGYAYYLYRSDMRSPGSRQSEASGEPMFGRTPRNRSGDGKSSDPAGEATGDRRK